MNKMNEHKNTDVFSKTCSAIAVVIVVALLASGAGIFATICCAILKVVGVVQLTWLDVWMPFLIPFGAEASVAAIAVVGIVIQNWLEDKQDAKENSR